MSLFKDWYRGTKRVSDERRYAQTMKKLQDGEGDIEDEYRARALALKLGVRTEKKGKKP